MKIALIGNGPHATTRTAAIRATDGAALAEHLPEATAAGVIQRQEAVLDVVFVCGEPGRRVQVAEAALRQGRHVFLEWPPAASVQELEWLAEHAEEAGAEVGVSRPLRFHPLFEALPDEARLEVLFVQERLGPPVRWPGRLTDALDLCCTLGGSVQRLEAQAARRGASSAHLEAVAFGVRFHSGAYAQVGLRRDLGTDGEERCLYAAGSGFRLEARLDAPDVRVHCDEARSEKTPGASADEDSFPEQLLRRETRAFLQALRMERPAPVSILDALQAMRLTERLMQQLR